jgi:signal peptidase II
MPLRHWLLLAAVAVGGLGLDVATKYWAEATLTAGRHVRVLGELLGMVLVHNRGMLFSIDPRAFLPFLPVNLFFQVFTAIAVVVIVLYYRAMAPRDAWLRWGLALVTPGALGNLYDRFVRPAKGVVDFIMIDLNIWPADPWPIFNVADIFLTCGVLLILASLVRDEVRRARARTTPPPAPQTEQPQTPPLQ